MKETSGLSIYVHCYVHRLNLALEGSFFLVPNLKNALGRIQSLYYFIGRVAKRIAFFKDIEVEGELLSLLLKLLSETRGACRYKVIRTVGTNQLKRIIKMLVLLVLDKHLDAKTSSDAQCLVGAICTLNFIFIKFILSNTSALCIYFEVGCCF